MKPHWITQNLWLIPFLPFLAAGITALFKQRSRTLSSAIVILAMAGSFLLSLCACAVVLKTSGHGHETFKEFYNFEWFSYGDTVLKLGFLLDPLSAMMLFVVSFVSLLVFIFSVGYMDHDENATRFFTFLSLFAGSMLLLVVANSLLLLFMAWELVGLSSFLLIGFWYHKPSAAAAMKKAFITTRIGDVGFLIGVIWFYYATGTTLFYDEGKTGSLEIARNVIAVGVALKIALLLFCGAVGKSGQFPLHVWLPDAMEGPTPVSALIHAATMVAAGVFLVGRMYPIFEINPTALEVVAYTGAFTALFAATIALAQWDIKRILAYSTVSQLGYMMMGLGVGGYVGGLFHLFTHAFFKALLFLGSGAIIYACHHEQDIRKMGGLKDKMPVTMLTYFIGMLALAGLAPLAGFFSKDEILLDCLYFAGNWEAVKAAPYRAIPLVFGMTGAFLTAFYMTRQVRYVFFGHPRSHGSEHAHEASSWMTLPLILLGVMALIAGFAGWPGNNYFHHIVGPHTEGHHFSWWLAGISSVVVVIAIGTGWKIYNTTAIQESEMDPLEAKFPAVFKVLHNKYYVDEFYEKTFVAFTYGFAKVVNLIDRYFIGGIVVLTKVIVFILSWINQQIDESAINKGFDKGCTTVRKGASLNDWIQTGLSQHYLKLTSAGIVLIFLLALILGR